MTLHHLTLNTGHVAETERADVADDVIALLRPLIPDGGPIPGSEPWTLDVWPDDGHASYQIAPGRVGTPAGNQPYVICSACWREDAAHAAWSQLGTIALMFQLTLPSAPPSTPWLAVILTPWIAMLSPETAQMLGDLERCIFWTLAEAQ